MMEAINAVLRKKEGGKKDIEMCFLGNNNSSENSNDYFLRAGIAKGSAAGNKKVLQ